VGHRQERATPAGGEPDLWIWRWSLPPHGDGERFTRPTKHNK
jgi:hypothetical protein